MATCQKHIDQPMSLLDLQLRQKGRYVYYIVGMDRTSSTVFWIFTTPTAAHVLECDYGRWAVEETFKGVKQLLGGQEPQTCKRQEPERAAGLSLWLYSMVWLWYLNQKASERYMMAQPWYGQKVTPSFADAIAGLRRRLWREKIKYMFGNVAVNDKKSHLCWKLGCSHLKP